MKKRILAVLFSMIFICSGCGQSAEVKKEAVSTEAAVSTENVVSTETAVSTEAVSTEVSSVDDEHPDHLPLYYFPGKDELYKEITEYITIELALNYDETDVCIPVINMLEIDQTDENDIKCYGDFWIYNYNLKGDVLETASGGDYPGVFHFKKNGNKYELIAFDGVEDGSDWDPSAKKIFGDRYDAFIKLMADSEKLNRIRTKMIADYVSANNLDIKSYQDYGWDPVELNK